METATDTKQVRPQYKQILEIERLVQREWLKSDQGVKLLAFYPFRDFYGGWLVYELQDQKYRMWCGNKMAAGLNVEVIYIYGKRAV